jgi:hypothetical protein
VARLTQLRLFIACRFMIQKRKRHAINFLFNPKV